MHITCYLAYYAEKERVLKKLSHFNHPSFVGGETSSLDERFPVNLPAARLTT